MKNSFVSLGGLSPIQKQGAEVFLELCATDDEFYIYSNIDDPSAIHVKCYGLWKPFFAWLNRRKLYYGVYGFTDCLLHLVLC